MSIEEEDKSELKELIDRAQQLLEQTRETTKELFSIAEEIETESGRLPKLTTEVAHVETTTVKVERVYDEGLEHKKS